MPIEHVLIVSNKKYRSLILDQLPQLRPEQLLLEPSRNNTGPCVALTALHIRAKNENGVFAMLPSDHIIKNETTFISATKMGFEKAASQNAIVTLGITPTRPDTGYGYIDFDAESREGEIFKVRSFKEKPAIDTAREYLTQGSYVWNAGIFIWSVATILKAFASSDTNILNVLSHDLSKFGTTEEQDYIDQVYPDTTKISVDFAILEKAKNVYTIPVDIGWSDLGTWNSLYQYLSNAEEDNVLLSNKVHVSNARGNLIKIKDPDKLVIIKDMDDFIIVDEGDVLLIYPREKEQEIKEIRTRFAKGAYE